jgi:hypothetical protein
LERLKFVDVAQFLWFSKRGRPLELIHKLLKDSALLSVPMAKKFGLIDSHYSKKDFLKDRVKIRKISKI